MNYYRCIKSEILYIHIITDYHVIFIVVNLKSKNVNNKLRNYSRNVFFCWGGKFSMEIWSLQKFWPRAMSLSRFHYHWSWDVRIRPGKHCHWTVLKHVHSFLCFPWLNAVFMNPASHDFFVFFSRNSAVITLQCWECLIAAQHATESLTTDEHYHSDA